MEPKHLQTFLKDLRVEQYRLIYEAAEAMGGIFPKNDWMKEAPRSLAETDQIVARNIRKLIDSGIWAAQPPQNFATSVLSSQFSSPYLLKRLKGIEIPRAIKTILSNNLFTHFPPDAHDFLGFRGISEENPMVFQSRFVQSSIVG